MPTSASRPGRRAIRPRSTVAVAIRKLFDGKALVSGVKSTLAHIHNDAGWARVAPPLAPFPAADKASANAGYDAARAKRVA